MNLTPIFTEKSMKVAKDGVYSFWVLPSLSKSQIKKLVGDTFGVKVESVKTLNYKKSVKRNFRGRTVTKPAHKKALVTLSGKDKIEIFEEVKK